MASNKPWEQVLGSLPKLLLGLSPQVVYRKEFLVKISLLLLAEKAIAFLD